MDPFTIALLSAIAKVGIDAIISLLEHPRTNIDEVIAALKIAKDKSLQSYIDDDKAATAAAERLKALPKLPGA